MFQFVMTFLGGLAAILVADAIRRWRPFKWWLALGYWFNAQAWGGRDDNLMWVQPSCWSRVLPAPLCRAPERGQGRGILGLLGVFCGSVVLRGPRTAAVLAPTSRASRITCQ